MNDYVYERWYRLTWILLGLRVLKDKLKRHPLFMLL